MALLRCGGLRAGAAGAGFGGGWEMQRALSLAQNAGFARGEAQVQYQELQGGPAEGRIKWKCTKSDVAPILHLICGSLLAHKVFIDLITCRLIRCIAAAQTRPRML